MAKPVLALEGVTKRYRIGTPAEVEVLHATNLSLASGEFSALIGPSGSGKSTLLNLIGLLDRPSGGTIQLAGQQTGRLTEAALTRLRGESLGFVFQFHHLINAFSVAENVCLPLMARDRRLTRSALTRAEALLDAVGLPGFGGRWPSELSGGQQQRVAVARALVVEPMLVLADEPTGNLDTGSADEIFALMRRFNREHGTAFLIVTHSTELARRCDRHIHILDGQVSG
ncbi:ABC transporter ATP-binding protein [Saccharospirillum impatiens]|uniref:ABC transporter ATP-binding protein n=1 Tax=Saccharospirillum impatiens TaxID=169438 RepID=UPI0004127F8A|nr:ABC transporter ATP-binding protein [Saccharospirillum impatiens]